MKHPNQYCLRYPAQGKFPEYHVHGIDERGTVAAAEELRKQGRRLVTVTLIRPNELVIWSSEV